MKFLFICEFFPSCSDIDVHGGVEARTYYIAKYLARKHQVYVLTSNVDKKKQEFLLGDIYVRRVGPVRKYSQTGELLGRIGFIIAAIRHGFFLDFEVVEGSGFISWLPAWILKKIKQKKGTVLVADTIETYTSDLNLILRHLLIGLEKFLLARSWDKIVCISIAVKNKVENFSIKSKLEVIYCGADARFICQIRVKKASFPRICCVSRLVSYKRIQDLLDATSFIRNKFPRVCVDIIGSGEKLKSLIKLTSELQLSKNVKFHNFVSSHAAVLRLIKRAQVFCLPSLVEGFGIVTVEALAAGVPVVLADIPINREVTQNRGVLFFTPGDSSDLASKLNKLLSSQQLYKHLQMEALQVAKKYDWEKIAKETETMYANLCHN